MKVVFRCNSRCMGYKPGVIYTTELTALLKVVIEQDRHLSLIDPPSLSAQALTGVLQSEPEPLITTPVLKPEPKPKPTVTKLVKKNEEEKLDDGYQESI